jgi:hypothetical protein
LETIQGEVESLLTKNCIEEVPLHLQNQGFYSNVFIVPKKPTGLRPILNLKLLNTDNRFLPREHFKMESLKSVKAALNPGDYFNLPGPD